MTLVITGATGLVGSALVSRLAGHGTLRVLVRRTPVASGTERLAASLRGRALDALAAGEIEVFEGDLTHPDLGLDPVARQRLARSVTGICHLAARTDFAGATLEEYRPVNTDAALTVTGLAGEFGCPLVLVSTAYVSGDFEGLFHERDRQLGQRFHNPYEQSKLEAEIQVSRLAAQRGIPLAVFRPGVIIPDAPVSGIPPGPGPLVHLRYLTGLEGEAGSGRRTVRCHGDPDAELNLVPLAFVARILARALEKPGAHRGTYHLTAGRPSSMADIAAAINRSLSGVEVVVVPAGELVDPDRFERVLERRTRSYRPYQLLRTRYDRSRLVRDFDGEDGVEHTWLARSFANHLREWSAARNPDPVVAAGTLEVRRYFDTFLAGKTGALLVPGLSSLSADFTVTVPAVGSFQLSIEEGVLRDSRPVSGPSQEFDYELEAAALLDAVTARVRPAELFFEQRIRIRGDVYRALATATALEDFFVRFPFQAHSPLEVAP